MQLKALEGACHTGEMVLQLQIQMHRIYQTELHMPLLVLPCIPAHLDISLHDSYSVGIRPDLNTHPRLCIRLWQKTWTRSFYIAVLILYSYIVLDKLERIL